MTQNGLWLTFSPLVGRFILDVFLYTALEKLWIDL